MWHAKTKWFAAAAAIAVAGSLMLLYRPLTERGQLRAGGPPPIVDQVISQGDEFRSAQVHEEIQSASNIGFTATNMERL